jgi:NAD(P)-dependent dehydrogenase (short-subunit alcohol dehydrogenase family)
MVDRVIAVFGGAGGIGAEIARRAAAEGARVVVADLNEEAARATAAEIGGVGVGCDITKPEQCDRAAQVAIDQFGQLDAVVNSAGISRPVDSIALDPADWARMVDVQMNGAFYVAQACAKRMWDRGGAIVFISSINAEAAFPRRAAYCASKAGIAMLTKVLAVEWAPQGIRVNAVGPAHVRTPMTQRNIDLGNISEEQISARVPMGRLVMPGEVADAVSFLLGDGSRFITGQSLYVDGGWLAYGYF